MPPVIDLPKLQEIRKKLKDLPRVPRVKTFSGPEALEALKKDLQAVSRKGYEPKEIAGILKQEGLSASAAKVRKILAGAGQGNGSMIRPEGPAKKEKQPAAEDGENSSSNKAGGAEQAAPPNSGPLTPFSEKGPEQEAQL